MARARALGQTLLTTEAARRLCLTATPVELAASNWDQALDRIGIGGEDRMRVRAAVERYDAAAWRVRLYGTRSERTARLLDQLEMQLEDAEAALSEDELAAEAAAVSMPGGNSPEVPFESSPV